VREAVALTDAVRVTILDDMQGRVPRWLSAAAMLPLLVLALSAPLSAIRCRFTGLVVATCCCPDADRAAPQDRQLRAEDCCRLEQREAVRTASELPGPAPRLSMPVVMAPLALDLQALAPRAPARVHQRDGTLPRPPLVLAKRSFLI
jgi:hypothetical protein